MDHWSPSLAAAGLALLAAAVSSRSARSAELHAQDGTVLNLSVSSIATIEEGPLVSSDGTPGCTLRMNDGAEVRVVEPISHVLGLARDLVAMRASRPLVKGGDGLVHVRIDAISSVRQSPMRLVGSDQKDSVILVAGREIRVRESVDWLRGLL